MQKDDKSMLEEIYQDVKDLKQLHTISHEMHVEHHDFIQQLIEDKKQTRKIKDELYEKLVVSGVWGALGVIALLLWLGIKEWLKRNV